jgi:hypothetical protein
MYHDGNSKHLGIAVCFTDDESDIENKIAKKVKELYPSGYLIKLSNSVEELKDDVVVIK